MKIVVVGGQSRNLGKTSLVCELIRALVEFDWTAVKITQMKPGECPVNRPECGCGAREHGYALEEERDASGRGDSSRFLAAGAARSLWARVKPGQLGAAWAELGRELAGARHVILESNSILDFVTPELYLIVLDSSREDFKESARRNLARADAIVLRAGDGQAVGGSEVEGWLVGKRKFVLPPGRASSPELVELVRTRVCEATVRR